MADNSYYQAMDQLNLIKTEIVHKYFWAWAKVMLPASRHGSGRIGYMDLFAGPGRFEDGGRSTPIWILEKAISDPELRNRLVTTFNDINPNYVENLRKEIAALPKIDLLRYPPHITNYSVDANVAREISDLKLIPTLFFIDPWGYKGITLDLIGAAIRDWGCECILFFNYNRINSGIHNDFVSGLMEGLFGTERAMALRTVLKGQDPAERENTIMTSFTEALSTVGGSHVLPFAFENETRDRLSHYVIFVTKHPRGYHIMKDVMWGLSSGDNEVRRLEYAPVRSDQMKLFPRRGAFGSLESLKEYLCAKCSGSQRTVKQIYEENTVGTPYVLRNVKDALRELEAEGRITIDPHASKRKFDKASGKVTLADSKIVTFPRQKE